MNPTITARADLQSQIAADARALSAESEQIGQLFAGVHDLGRNDFRALLDMMVAEGSGTPLTAGQLRQKLGLSAAAITYLVERMIESGHIARDCDRADRRKVILRYSDEGRAVGPAFFTPLAEHSSTALAHLPDRDLAAAHRVLTALIDAMRAFQNQLNASRATSAAPAAITTSDHTAQPAGHTPIRDSTQAESASA
jgi:DNA-binding MarR family transcriptional regulator